MYLWFLSHPEMTHHFLAAQEARRDAISHGSSVVFSGLVKGLSWIGAALQARREAAAERRHRRAAIASLRAFDDRLLKDIGIERRRIRDVVEATLSSPETEPDEANVAAAPAPALTVVASEAKRDPLPKAA